jgi:RNA-binding protein
MGPVHLTGKQKRHLRALGHGLRPLVQVGKQGLVASVVSQTQACLAAHELVKVKLLESCPMDREQCADALAEATGAAVAQTLGRTLLLYRPRPEDPQIQLPPGRVSGNPPAAGEERP